MKMTRLPSASEALPGREMPMALDAPHVLSGRDLRAPTPKGMERAMFGMGCFWGVERLFWSLPGVWLTMVGYAGGHTQNPDYKEVCSGMTGHNEVVRIIYDPSLISYDQLLKVFWENHDPTQGMRQGNDRGTQYRSGIYTYSAEQGLAAETSRTEYAARLVQAGHGAITTEIRRAPDFYFAEQYHQQYLAKEPNGYCGIRGTGVTCPIGLSA